ncbi:MAG: two-component regulator propeller domain-containing protein [Cytophagales bacterium]|nr:two-component regulator propeller domain-containing protein [Cytophagales bacterium]
MRIPIRYLLFFLLCGCLYVSQAQSNFRFAHLGTKEGLLSDDAYCMLEDSMGFIWIGTETGLQRFDGDELVDFPIVVEGLTDLFVRDLILQGEDTLWVAIRGGGVRAIVNGKVTNAITVENGLSSNLAECLMVDHEGTLWVGTIDAGINAIANGEVIHSHRLSAFASEMTNHETYALMEDRKGNIWEGTTQGIHLYFQDGKQTSFRHQDDDPGSLSHDYAHEIYEDQTGNIWIGTVDGGLNLYNEQDSSFNSYQYDAQTGNQISHNVILAIEQDHDSDGLWIGTWGGGLNFFDGVNFVSGFDEGASSTLRSDRIEDVLVDSRGDLWIATYQGGINKYYQQTFITYNNQENLNLGMLQNRVTDMSLSLDGSIWLSTNDGVNKYHNGSFETFSEASGHLKFNDINQIYEDREGGLWMGMIGTGRGLQYLKNGELKHYAHIENDPNSISSDFIESIFQDRQDRIWIGTRDGLNLFQEGTFIRFKYSSDQNSIPSNQIRDISGGKDGGLWIATYGGGLSYFKNGTFKNFLDPEQMPYKFLWDVAESHDGNDVWIATSGGVVKFDPNLQLSTFYGDRDGLIGERVSRITIDSKGQVWAGSSKGLGLYLNELDKFKTFTSEDGLAGDNINAILEQENKLYVGGEAGFAVLDLNQFSIQQPESQLLFTRLEILDTSPDNLSQTQEWEPLNGEVALPHDQNNLTLYYSSLKLGIDDDPQYAYFIDQINQDWVFNGNSNHISLIDLSPGEYQIQVRELSAPESITLKLTIFPPFWNTTIAQLFYLTFLASLGYLIFLFMNKRKKLREDLERSEYNRESENKLNGLKLRFFTNVSHELRTPLTLILGPVQDLIDQKAAPAYHEKLMFIRDNSERLLKLTNQLLDFRKVSMDRMALAASNQDIISLIKACFQAFHFEAAQKALDFELKHSQTSLKMYFDHAKLETVLMNLLSNAFKFQQGRVTIEAQVHGDPEEATLFENLRPVKNYLKISISDNGEGISKEDIPMVFDRFYQAKHQDSMVGTGIGLALAKDLIELHHGTLTVKSTPNENTSFTIRLPFGFAHLSNSEIIDIPTLESATSSRTEAVQKRPELKRDYTILLIEDNPDLRTYLATELSHFYQVITAENGIEGLQALNEYQPDLIISDVMMPKMDGITFCREVKSNPENSHLPILLLTARSLSEHELEGLNAGANDYIIKPFNLDSLIAKIDNFIQVRKNYTEHYLNQLKESDESPDVAPSEEQTFISEVIAMIQSHLHQPTFGVSELSDLLGMSQSALYKKTKFLIGKSVVELISQIRIKEAAKQIIETDKRISEIGYQLGFNDPKYFRERFKKVYEMSPTEYRKQGVKIKTPPSGI